MSVTTKTLSPNGSSTNTVTMPGYDEAADIQVINTDLSNITDAINNNYSNKAPNMNSLAFNGDIDTLKTPGRYYINNGSSTLASLSNLYGTLFVMGNSTDNAIRATQLFIGVSSDAAWYRRLHADGWRDIQYILRRSDIANNLTTTAANMVLDARMGKTLNDKLENITDQINTQMIKSGTVDLNTLTQTTGLPEKIYSIEKLEYVTNYPAGLNTNFPALLKLNMASGYAIQELIVYNANGKIDYWQRQQYYSNGGRVWGAWQQFAIINSDITVLPAASGITCRYVIRSGYCYVHINGTATSTSNITFTVPKALLGAYVTTGQWGQTSNIMQAFIDANRTTLTVRNQALTSVNISLVYPVA